jgi:hypothetical protein
LTSGFGGTKIAWQQFAAGLSTDSGRFSIMKMPRLKSLILAVFLCLGIVPTSRADVMLTNLDQPAGPGGTPISIDFFWFANRFVTDASASSFTLENVTLGMDTATNTSGGFFVSIYSDASNLPGSQLELLTGSANPAVAGNYTYTSAGLNLSSDTSYWVVLGVSVGAGNYAWNLPTTDSYTGPWTIPTTATHAHSENQGASWSNGDGFARMFSVSAVAVPEPATYALLGLGLGVGIFFHKTRRQKIPC